MWLNELRLLYLVFGDGDVLVFGMTDLIAYYAKPAAERFVQLHCSELRKMVAWLTARSGEEGLFFAADDGWLLQMQVPDEWQKEKTTLFPPVPNEEKEPAATEIAKPEESVMEMNLAQEHLLKLPKPRGGRDKVRQFKERVIAIYEAVGSHRPRHYDVWLEAARGVVLPGAKPSATRSFLWRLENENELIKFVANTGKPGKWYEWNLPRLEECFGLLSKDVVGDNLPIAEEASSAAASPASAPAPSPEEVATVQEEVPDAIAEVVQPLTEPEKAAEFAEFVATAQLSYLDQLRAQHAEAVAAYEAQHERIQEARMQISTWNNALRQAENAVLPLAATMSEREKELKAELQSIAQTEVLKIAHQLKDLSPDVREQVMRLLSGQQR